MLFNKSWNANITDVLNGASVNFCAKILATLLGLISSLLLTRYYDAETVGNIATILSIVNIATILALCGFGTLTLKLIPTSIKNFGPYQGISLFKKISLIIFSHTMLIFLVLPTLLELPPVNERLNLSSSSWLPGLVVIFTSFLAILRNTLRGLGDYIKYSLLDFLASGFLVLIILVSVWSNANKATITHTYFIAYFMAFALALVLVQKQFQKTVLEQQPRSGHVHPTPKLSHLYHQAWPMLGVAASQILIVNMDVLCIGYFSTQHNVGIYSIYLKLVTVTAFATTAVNSMLAPKVAVLFEQNNTSELRRFIKQTTLISTISVVILAGAFLSLHRFILEIYGDDFLNDLSTLYLLLASTVINSCFGSVGFFLNMTGQQRSFLKIMVFAFAINLSLNIVLVPSLGMLGAALATLFTSILWNSLATFVIYRQHKFTLFPI